MTNLDSLSIDRTYAKVSQLEPIPEWFSRGRADEDSAWAP